jgi:cytochrome c oxidase subunit 1
MPRRYFDYPPKYQTLHVLSTAGSWVLATGMALPVIYLVWSAFWGPRATDNPWGSRSFEWRTTTPPPKHNFTAQPDFTIGTYDYATPVDVAEEAL